MTYEIYHLIKRFLDEWDSGRFDGAGGYNYDYQPQFRDFFEWLEKELKIK